MTAVGEATTDQGHNPIPPGEELASGIAAEPTMVLIQRIREGDHAARDVLLRRFMPLLKRWGRGRLPRHMRDVQDTDDLVQVTLMKALNHIDDLHSTRRGAFLQYLCQTLLNQVRDEIRRRNRHPKRVAIDPELSDSDDLTPIEQIVGAEEMHAYQQALSTLPKRQQALVLMRAEFGMSYPEIASEIGSTPDAVRVMIARAILQLSRRLEQ